MLNPRELFDVIGTCIAQSHHDGQRLAAGRVTNTILSKLPVEDRQGIDPELLRLIVQARAMALSGDGRFSRAA